MSSASLIIFKEKQPATLSLHNDLFVNKQQAKNTKIEKND